MRPALTVVLGLLVLVGIGQYLRFANGIRPPALRWSEEMVDAKISIDITLTFDARPTVFDIPPRSLVVEFRGRELYASDQVIPAGTPVLIEDAEGVVVGLNEFFVSASAGDGALPLGDPMGSIGDSSTSGNETIGLMRMEAPSDQPPSSGGNVMRAIRVRVLRDGLPIAEQTLWSEPGQPVRGTVTVEVARQLDTPTDDHHAAVTP